MNQTRRQFIATGLTLLPYSALAFGSRRLRRRRVSPPEINPSAPLGHGDVSAAQSSFTFSSMSLGDPHSNRRIFACFAWRDAEQISDPTGVTIAGVAGNLFVRSGYETTSVCIYEALIPSGTAGDVVISFGEVISYGCSCTLLRVLHATTAPSFSTQKNSSKSNGNPSPSFSVTGLGNLPANSLVIGIGAVENTSSNCISSPYTEIVERNGANGFRYAVSTTFYSTAQSNPSLTFTSAGSTASTFGHNYVY